MTNTSSVLEFKSSTFFTPILILYSNDPAAIEQSLQEKINRAPDFFKNSPLVIDLRELNKSGLDIDVIETTEMLRRIGLFPIGIRGGNEQQNKQANKLSIPVDAGGEHDSANQTLNTGTTKAQSTQQPPQDSVADNTVQNDIEPSESIVHIDSTQSPAEPVSSMIVTQPVRSGQRIYARGDLIVMSQVSAGAEIMAEGNIHVYNTLRGRALAGVQGNTAARIFCLDLQAELISISGDYKTSEHLTKQMQKKPVQIYLQDHALIIKEIA
ncbi:MAG: septum site-determining protein MinC [Nitrosomonas sp.]|nr:septum site-determining protein MinC [Nitrosomonas sp.]